MRSQVLHDSGHHFIIRFDASPATQRLVHKFTATDPRMIRCGVVRMGKGGTLGEIMDVEGMVVWQRLKLGGEGGLGIEGEMGRGG